VIQLVLYLLVGSLLLLSLTSLAARRAEGGSSALVQARRALDTLQVGLLPADLVARVFDRADLDYVQAQPSAEVRQLFIEERKRVALLWVSRVRKQVLSLRKFHLGASRFYAELRLATELSLALDFACLLLACRVLQAFIYLRGPYAAPRIVGSMAATATRVCDVSQKSLAFLTPAYAARVADGAARPAR